MILALIGTGLAAGFINTTAGGGSMLTLPLLMFIGLPANVANGTNRIAILLQNVVAVRSFQKNKVLDFKTDYRLAVPAVIGAFVGSLVAVEVNVELLRKIIAGLMVVLLFFVLLKPGVWLKDQVEKADAIPGFWQYFLFLLIGFYGGFIQMGVGFFLIAGLVLGCEHGLVKSNAIKVFIILLYTIVSLAVFAWNGQVDVVAGLILAAGNMTGAWLGARFTVNRGAKFVRYVLIGAMLIVILNLFGVFG